MASSDPAPAHLDEGPALPVRAEVGRSLGRDAWLTLRSNWIFWASIVLITLFVLMAAFPGLFTHKDPLACGLANARGSASGSAWFGYDVQGCDVYTLTIHGARASIVVGVIATLVAMIVGAGVGVYAGFYGGIVDTLLSRLTDIFIGIPILVGSILILSALPSGGGSSIGSILKVSFTIAILGWTSTARVARSSVIQVKGADYVSAARALGASQNRIIRKHILPNAIAPVIVVTTISLGGYIGAEATLSFLGIGLQPPVISWGIAINDAQAYVRSTPHMLIFPALFLSLTVLAFIALGDAVREALDPKAGL
jgi:oligopeptide transport system permease protein